MLLNTSSLPLLFQQLKAATFPLPPLIHTFLFLSLHSLFYFIIFFCLDTLGSYSIRSNLLVLIFENLREVPVEFWETCAIHRE